jgi:hypothetical protein
LLLLLLGTAGLLLHLLWLLLLGWSNASGLYGHSAQESDNNLSCEAKSISCVCAQHHVRVTVLLFGPSAYARFGSVEIRMHLCTSMRNVDCLHTRARMHS